MKKQIRVCVKLVKVLAIFLPLLAVAFSTGRVPYNPGRSKRDAIQAKISQKPFSRKNVVNALSRLGIVNTEVPDWVKQRVRDYVAASPSQDLKAFNAYKARDWDRLSQILASHRRRGGVSSPKDITSDPNDWRYDQRVNSLYSGQQGQCDVEVGSDGTIYVTYMFFPSSGGGHVYFCKSTDGGASFATPVLIDNIGDNNRPRIAVWGTGATARVYVAYVYWYDYPDLDIYCGYSVNGGASFSIKGIATSTEYEDAPSIAVDNSNYVYIAWGQAITSGGGCDEETIDTYIMCQAFSNITSSPINSYYIAHTDGHQEWAPSIDVYGGGYSSTLHCAYMYDYGGDSSDDYDIRYRKVTNAGSSSPSVGSVVWIAASTSNEWTNARSLTVGGGNNPYITYSIERTTGDEDVYCRRSTNGGSSFLSAVTIASNSWESMDAVIDLDVDGNPFIVWRDNRNGNTDIYMRYSNDGGSVFEPEKKVNKGTDHNNQYWPSVALWRASGKRRVDVVWWDQRTDDGDIYYNANLQYRLQLNISVAPGGLSFSGTDIWWDAFESSMDTTVTPRTLVVWNDPEYYVRIDEFANGSSSTQRWACQAPSSGWSFLPDAYWRRYMTAGETYDVVYYHQFYSTLGYTNGSSCSHPFPNVPLTYTTFGVVQNTHPSVTDWIDRGTTYDYQGYVLLDPHQRWATQSADTTGTVYSPVSVSPAYYHQWLPTVFLVGPDAGNSVWHIQRSLYGSSVLESGLYDSWSDWVDCESPLEFSDVTTGGWHAIDSTLFSGSYFIATIRYVPLVDVFVTNSFGYGQMIVDGVTYDVPDTFSWVPGTEHTLSAISPQTFGDTIRYIFTGWSDGESSATRTVIVPEYDASYTANFSIQYHLTLTYTGPTGGHTPVLTGEGWYDAGTSVPITATESFDSSDVVRYGFDHWSSDPIGAVIDDSTSSSASVLMDRSYQLTANYMVQFRFDVFNPDGYDAPVPGVGQHWYSDGATVEGSVASPDTVYHMYCTGYDGTGSLSSGTGSSFSFVIHSPSSVTWHWDEQLTLEVISDVGSPEPPVGTNYFDPGTMVDASVPDDIVDISDGMRLACVSHTGTGSAPSGDGSSVSFTITENSTLTWNWVYQYRFIVSNPLGVDDPRPPAGEYWYDEGSFIAGGVDSPSGGYFCGGYLATGSLVSAPYDTFEFEIYSPTTITWRWINFTEVESLTVITDYGSPRPHGRTYYERGTAVTVVVTSPFYAPWEDDGVRHTCTGYTDSSSVGVFTGSDTMLVITLDESHWVSFSWETEYRFVVNNPSGYDDPVPEAGEHWYVEGSTVTGSVTSPVEDSVFCDGYEGTGSLTDGTSSSFSFVIMEPSSINWLWSVHAYDLVVVSDYGTPTPAVGTHRYPEGTEITAYINLIHPVVDGERYACTGWTGPGSGDAEGADTTMTFVIMENSSIQWNWLHQYRFVVSNPGGHDTPVPDVGEYWYEAGTEVVGYMTDPIVDTFYCVGYNGTGELGSRLGYTEFAFEINAPSSVEWLWVGESNAVSLTVSTDMGEPEPTVGVHWYPRDTEVHCYIDDVIPVADGERYHCVGYEGTGSIASGGATSFTVVLGENSTLHWVWRYEYRFVVNNPDGHDTPVPRAGEHWYEAGTEVTGYVTSPDGDYYCIGYEGTGSLPSGSASAFSFVIESPSSVTWLWATDVVRLDVFSDFGPTDPPVGTTYWVRGTTVNAYAPAWVLVADTAGVRYLCTGWTGTGDVPPRGTTNSFSFEINNNSTITWHWQKQFELTLEYSGVASGVEQTGSGWYNQGDTADISTSEWVEIAGDYFGFLVWTGDSADITIGNPSWASTYVVMDAPHTLEAVYTSAVECIIVKEPYHTWGSIFVDGIEYPDSGSITKWWGLGSIHEIGVTTIDSLGRERYLFQYWSDGGDTFHTVGPIRDGVVFTASYVKQYFCTITKEPAEDYGYIWVGRTPFWGAHYWSDWMDEDTLFDVEVSELDVNEPAGAMYIFDHWSDGEERRHTVGPLMGYFDLVAYYNSRYKITISKEPSDDIYGTITLGDTTYTGEPGVWTVSTWVAGGEVYPMTVSTPDLARDYIYTFDHWSDGGELLHNIGPVDTMQSYIAYYRRDTLVLSFEVTPDNVWDLGSIYTGTTVRMEEGEEFNIENTSSVPVDFGLEIYSTGHVWTASYSSSVDRFALFGRFQDTRPDVYLCPSDWIKHGSLFWASAIFFGPGGFNVPPPPDPDRFEKLWMEFVAPTVTSTYERQTIIVKLFVRPHL